MSELATETSGVGDKKKDQEFPLAEIAISRLIAATQLENWETFLQLFNSPLGEFINKSLPNKLHLPLIKSIVLSSWPDVWKNEALDQLKERVHYPLLHLTAMVKGVEGRKMAEFLISQKASLHAISSSGSTVASYVIYHQNIDVLGVLLSAGLSITDAPNHDGDTLLHLSAFKGDLAMTGYLLDKGAPVGAKNRQGYTALQKLMYVEKTDHTKMIELLLAHKASVEDEDGFSESVLHLAAQYASEQTMLTLIRHKASTEKQDDCGQTPLHIAAQNVRVDAAKCLLDNKASLNVKDYQNRTALHHAVGHTPPSKALIELLITRQADVNAPSDLGLPLEIALNNIDTIDSVTMNPGEPL